MATKSKFMPSTLSLSAMVPLPLIVLVDLSIEGERPGEEIDPADDLNEQLLPVLHPAESEVIL